MKDKLLVIIKYKDLISLYSNYSLIFPKKYYHLKDILEDRLFANLREMYIINSLSDKKVRLLKKEELLGNLKYLNFLFEEINKLGILSDKQYKNLFMTIENVYKYLIGWLKVDM